MSDNTPDTHIAVIGGGPGGYAAAFMAADLGLDVTLINLDENPGGTCSYRGCIPSKALLHAAQVLNQAKEASDWGIKFAKPTIDVDQLRAAVKGVVSKLTGGLGQLSKARQIKYIQGRASFIDSNTLQVDRTDGKSEALTFRYAILASGSRPAIIESLLIDSPRMLNSTTALELHDIPKSLLVIGGGYIGLELGSVYAALGSKVTVVEATAGLLPGADRDLVAPLAKRLADVFEVIHLNTKVTGVKEMKKGIKVTMEGHNLARPEQTFDKVLISVGRKPNSSGLGLANTRVEVDPQGFVVVDEQRRTADPGIFAVGDVAGQPMLAHKATHEGHVAAEVIAGKRVAFEPQAIPAVVFTDPEIAWVGITEDEAKNQGLAIKVGKFPWTASGRATTLNRNDGLTKVLCDPDTDRILGVGIVGHGAGELIAEGALAIEMGALASDVQLTIHPHPTLGETLMESAESIYGRSAHVFRPKKA